MYLHSFSIYLGDFFQRLTVFLHSGERFDTGEDFSQLSHSLRSLLFVALPLKLLLRQHLLEHLQEGQHRC